MNKLPDVRLTVVILSRNESDSIESCLKSICWADEVILLDDSDDDTVEKAKRICSQIFIHPTKTRKNFSDLRNLGLRLASNEWVLFLDADERTSQNLKEEILSVIHKPNVNGFLIKRKDFFLGRWLEYGETGNMRLLKLGKKRKGRWQREVHEVWDIEGNIGVLQEVLYHYPHPTVREFIERINRWTDLDAQTFYRHGKRASYWKIIAYPTGKFLVNYIFRQGFRDGMPGFIMALSMSFHSFLTRAKLFTITSLSSK